MASVSSRSSLPKNPFSDKPRKSGKSRAAEQPFGFPRRPKFPTPPSTPVFERGPRELAAALAQPEYASGPGEPPPHLAERRITKPEWYVYWALERLGKRPNVDFIYRGEIAENFSLSLRAQLDFTMVDGSQVAFEVQGTHWHYEMGEEKVALDQFRRVLIMGQGYTVVFIDEDPLVKDPTGEAAKWLVQEALEGRDHSYQSNPYTFTQ